jgi:nicotinamidase-related amidase
VGALATAARAAGALVVHVQHDGAVGAPDEPGAPGWELALEPVSGEHVIRKRGEDGFHGTGLQSLLHRRGVGAIALCGVQSEMCVAATARVALAHGLTVVLPRGAHGTYPIPADGPSGVAVPASHVARVAEWSLGDEIVAPEWAEVEFRPPG